MNRKLKLKELQRLSAEEYKIAEKTPVVFVLDNIRSLNNIGSVFRTADAFRFAGVHLCGYTAQPPHRDITKTALGATETVDWEYYATTLESVTALKEQGYAIYAVEQTESTLMLQDIEASAETPIALVLGNEVEGVQQEVIDAADACVEIPQLGTKHSLNVSVCAGIVGWQFFHKMRKTML